MILDEFVEITVAWSTKLYYEQNGYGNNLKQGDKIYVKIEHLFPNSKNKVLIKCDYCGNEVYMPYYQILNSTKTIDKHNCMDCLQLKKEEIFMEKYGVKHQLQLKEIQDKIKQTSIERYGVSSCLQSNEIRDKIKQTNLNKYGHECVLSSPEIRRKIEKTCMIKYGVDHIGKSDIIRDRINQTNLEQYGCEFPFQSANIQEKTKRTNLQKYGYKNSAMSPIIHQKIQDTCMRKYGAKTPLESEEIFNKTKLSLFENYGVEYTFQSPEILAKSMNAMYKNGSVACSSQQKIIHELLGGELNYLLGRIFLDIAFVDEKICIEYNGSGHNLSVLLNNITQEEFDTKEMKRDYFIINNGWKIIKIISSKDKLLPNNELVTLVKYAKWYLSSDRTWANINLDIMKFECSQYTKSIEEILSQ